MTERNGVIEPDEQRRLSGFNPDFPTDAALDNLVADRYRLMSHMERDELVREMADAISTLRERIATLEKEQTELDKVRYDEIMALREQNGALSERIAALERTISIIRPYLPSADSLPKSR